MDYDAMVNMMFEKYLDFDVLLDYIQRLEDEINKLHKLHTILW